MSKNTVSLFSSEMAHYLYRFSISCARRCFEEIMKGAETISPASKNSAYLIGLSMIPDWSRATIERETNKALEMEPSLGKIFQSTYVWYCQLYYGLKFDGKLIPIEVSIPPLSDFIYGIHMAYSLCARTGTITVCPDTENQFRDVLLALSRGRVIEKDDEKDNVDVFKEKINKHVERDQHVRDEHEHGRRDRDMYKDRETYERNKDTGDREIIHNDYKNQRRDDRDDYRDERREERREERITMRDTDSYIDGGRGGSVKMQVAPTQPIKQIEPLSHLYKTRPPDKITAVPPPPKTTTITRADVEKERVLQHPSSSWADKYKNSKPVEKDDRDTDSSDED